MIDIPASSEINQIEQLVQEAGLQAIREATGKVVRAVEAQNMTCPHCGSEVVRSEGTDRRVILTKYGRVVLALRRLRCLSCRGRFRPAEACLKALQAGNVTAALP
jgi:transposase-like protein